MNLFPKITLIVPVYKIKREYLTKCLDSLSNQTADESLYEVILIDDNNNNDECGAICDEYALKNANFRVFHQVNQGVSVARNLGITESKAPYLAFVDADDWVELNAIEIMLKALEECVDADLICFSHVANFKNKQLYQGISKANKKQITKINELQNHLLKNVPEFEGLDSKTPWAKIYKKELILKNNTFFKAGVRRNQDIIFNLYYLQHCKSVIYINSPFYHYNINQGSTFFKENKSIIEQREKVNSIYQNFADNFNKTEEFQQAVHFRILSSINTYYQLYFGINTNSDKKKEFKYLLNRKMYKTSLDNIDLKRLSSKEKIYILVLKTKSLKLLSLLNKAENFHKKKIKKQLIN